MTMPDPNDILFGSSVPSASFKQPGTTFAGVITKLDSSQQRDYKTGDPLVWADGKPKMQVILTVKTDLRDPNVPEDNGERRIFLGKKESQDAAKLAVRNAGARVFEVGGWFSLTYTHATENDWGGSPTKHFTAQYRKPQPGADAANAALGMGGAGTEGNAPVQQPVQQPMVQPGVAPTSTSAPQPAQGGVVTGGQTVDLSNASPEARAMVEKLLAAQQGGAQ